jgi:hypothetical protein
MRMLFIEPSYAFLVSPNFANSYRGSKFRADPLGSAKAVEKQIRSGGSLLSAP